MDHCEVPKDFTVDNGTPIVNSKELIIAVFRCVSFILTDHPISICINREPPIIKIIFLLHMILMITHLLILLFVIANPSFSLVSNIIIVKEIQD